MSVKPTFQKAKDKIIKSQKTLAQIVSGLKSQGKIVGFTNGCFDLLHVGHVRALEDASRRCDFLVVALNSDQSVLELKKRKTVTPEMERAEIIASLSSVDYVTFFDEERVDKLLRDLQPDIFAKGKDYKESTVPERDTAKEVGARIIIVGDPKNHSTTEILKKIRRRKR